MTIVKTMGNPALFITFTANPHWPEIERALKPGQQPGHRPDLVCTAFHLKFRQLAKRLRRGALGGCSGFSHIIEFQKRGLPHAHILEWLLPQDVPDTPAKVDEIVMAYVPEDDPELAELVKKYMVHGPCNERSPCWKDGKCCKGYPKAFAEVTIVHENAVPT
jgi:hypothetical protein